MYAAEPTKRGIRIWMRSDSKSGYVYDSDIYQGKSDGNNPEGGTLGERVVNKLLRTVKFNPADVTLAIDRFFFYICTSCKFDSFFYGRYVHVKSRKYSQVPKNEDEKRRYKISSQ